MKAAAGLQTRSRRQIVSAIGNAKKKRELAEEAAAAAMVLFRGGGAGGRRKAGGADRTRLCIRVLYTNTKLGICIPSFVLSVYRFISFFQIYLIGLVQ